MQSDDQPGPACAALARLHRPCAEAPVIHRNAGQAFAAGHYATALMLYEQKADEGDEHACAMVGYMLFFGPALCGAGVPCDRQRARRWLAIAAQGGHLLAQMLIRRFDRLESDARQFYNDPSNKEIEC
jgi:TPR repeat protein